MERVFSVEEISDPFWSSSAAGGGGAAAAGAGRGAMNRSPSEWLFEKFLAEEPPAANPSPRAAVPPNPSPNPAASSVVSSNFSSGRKEGGGNDEVVEVKGPRAPASELPADVDPGEYAAMLKQKLDMYCAVVAMSRTSGIKNQDSSIADTMSQASNSSQLGSQTPTKGGGTSGVPALPVVQNSGLSGRPATSGSSREQSDDDDLEGEIEMTDNMDPTDVKRVRRMLSNRESARRSRRRKQAHLSELEAQVSQLRVENSSLLKRLTDVNQKYSEAAVDNRILKADVETLRAKVKMAEDSVKRVTGASPMFPTMSDISSISMPFSGSPSEATSDAAVSIQDDPSHFFQASAHIASTAAPPVEDVVHSAVAAGGKMGRTVSMQRVASLEHLQKRICGGPGSCGPGSGSVQWDAAGWDHEISGNKNPNQV